LTALAKAAYPEPAVNLSYIKAASDPLGDAGDPYSGYDCPSASRNDLRLGCAPLHEIESAVAVKRCPSASRNDLRPGCAPLHEIEPAIAAKQWTQYVDKSDGTIDLDQTRKNNSQADWREARQPR